MPYPGQVMFSAFAFTGDADCINLKNLKLMKKALLLMFVLYPSRVMGPAGLHRWAGGKQINYEYMKKCSTLAGTRGFEPLWAAAFNLNQTLTAPKLILITNRCPAPASPE